VGGRLPVKTLDEESETDGTAIDASRRRCALRGPGKARFVCLANLKLTRLSGDLAVFDDDLLVLDMLASDEALPPKPSGERGRLV
jgi:hypothetical protein